MITLEKLNNWGADTNTGIKRCANNTNLYLKLVNMVKTNSSFKMLEDAIKNNNLEDAFQAAHGLKGILSNLELTPLLDPIKEITELLRNKKEMDYSPYLNIINKEYNNLIEICK
jgi:HPt (histidine-containing phosphotransfer) domain-containing protein